MESTRQLKFSSLIQKELGQIFQQDIKGMFKNAFITVTTVRMSPDLGLAKIYLSFMMVNDKQEMLENIEEQTGAIRNLLAKKIKNQVRVIPELHFFLDDTQEYAEKIDSLLDSLEIPPAEEDSEETN